VDAPTLGALRTRAAFRRPLHENIADEGWDGFADLDRDRGPYRFLSMPRRGIGEDYFAFFHDVFPLFASGGGDASGRGHALGGIIGTCFV
jgi:hypothetical protein